MGTHGPIKYPLVAKVFHQIDSDATAYWLGFLAADGTIGRNAVILSLATKDRAHVERFRRFLRARQPVLIYRYRARRLAFARLVICSRPLVKELARWRVVPKKTTTIGLPHIQKRWLGSFVRGYFDGDGSIGCYGRLVAHKYPWRRWTVRLMGSKQMMADIYRECERRGIHGYLHPEPRGRNCWQFIIDTLHSLRPLRAWLYNHATVYLPRKKQSFDRIPKER